MLPLVNDDDADSHSECDSWQPKPKCQILIVSNYRGKDSSISDNYIHIQTGFDESLSLPYNSLKDPAMVKIKAYANDTDRACAYALGADRHRLKYCENQSVEMEAIV